MINREDMLALTRRMTVKRTSITRIAGSYMDEEGFSEGTFNTHFQNLSPAEREKNLALAKAVPFSETNKNLKEYCFESEKDQNGKATVNPMRQLLRDEKLWPQK